MTIKSAAELANYWADQIESGREVGDLGITMNVAVRDVLGKREQLRSIDAIAQLDLMDGATDADS